MRTQAVYAVTWRTVYGRVKADAFCSKKPSSALLVDEQQASIYIYIYRYIYIYIYIDIDIYLLYIYNFIYLYMQWSQKAITYLLFPHHMLTLGQITPMEEWKNANKMKE